MVHDCFQKGFAGAPPEAADEITCAQDGSRRHCKGAARAGWDVQMASEMLDFTATLDLTPIFFLGFNAFLHFNASS